MIEAPKNFSSDVSADTDLTEEPSLARSTKRGLLRGALLGTAAGALALGSAARIVQEQSAASSDALYGTLPSLRFSPSSETLVRSHAYDSFLAQNAYVRDFRLAKLAGDEIPPPNLSITNNIGADQAIALPSSYTPEEAERFARALIERTLGEPLPESVTLKVAPVIIPKANGFAESFRNTATAEFNDFFGDPEADFYETVGTLVHEVGHLIFPYRHGQLTSLTPWQGLSYETSVREEAVAILFRLTVASQIDDPQIRFSLGGNIETLIENHLLGISDYGANEGAALCDAALTLSDGDYLAAWKILTDPQDLDPVLYEIIQRNRELYLEIKNLRE